VKPEPLPAHVWVRVTNPQSEDYGKVGEIVGPMDGQWDWLVRFEDHDAGFKDEELTVCSAPS
jgi:hypothetical protein